MKAHYIKEVINGSLADVSGIKSGDYLLTINGKTIKDVLDYRFLIADENVEIVLETASGIRRVVNINKEYDEDLGLIFDNPLMDKERTCRNHCIFCFVDQLPKDVRKTLRYKDDDWRLSFLDGNYITLTNLTKEDVKRICDMHISPLYVSIHATDPQVRSFMLGYPKRDIMIDILKDFYKNDIIVHGQIVLCPGINDGEILNDTLSQLIDFWPSLKSIALVPVGLTEHRDRLYPLVPYDKEGAAKLLEQAEQWQNICLDKIGTRWVFPADEFYLIASKKYLPYEFYENFPQLENGVGLLALFDRQFHKALKKYKKKSKERINMSLATGYSAYSFMDKLSKELLRDYNVKINVYPIKNNFFGQSITVAGLVVGRDIINQLADKELGKVLLLPSVMLRDGETVFLDGVTLDEIKRALNVDVNVIDTNGEALVKEVIRYR